MYKNTEGVIVPRQVIMALTNAAMYVMIWHIFKLSFEKKIEVFDIHALSHFVILNIIGILIQRWDKCQIACQNFVDAVKCIFFLNVAGVSRRRRGNFEYESAKLSIFVTIIANSQVEVQESLLYCSVPSKAVWFLSFPIYSYIWWAILDPGKLLIHETQRPLNTSIKITQVWCYNQTGTFFEYFHYHRL